MSLRLHGDTLAVPGALDFATCLWPNAAPDWLDKALADGLADRVAYPDDRHAREAIGARHGRCAEEVLLLNGACEAFWLLAHALRPRRAACVHPSFTEPEAALRATGTDIVRVQLDSDDWTLAPELVPADVELIVVGNPNNPTGTLTPTAALRALARPGRLLLVDESFIDFVPGDGASLAGDRDLPGLLVVRSLTKLYALAGIRAGYLLAPPELVRRLAEQRQPWSVNALACRLLAAAAADRQTPNAVAAEVADRRRELTAAVTAHARVRTWPSAANFLLISVRDGRTLTDGLLARGIAARPAASFPGLDDRHVRIAVRPAPDNERLVTALQEVLE
ncbi:MAG: aminotransferase class I/II-fold pyridoxal phosphate-dependent enzyme [Solirubrobacteraceae bacterium]